MKYMNLDIITLDDLEWEHFIVMTFFLDSGAFKGGVNPNEFNMDYVDCIFSEGMHHSLNTFRKKSKSNTPITK